jgi:hypothetical protein
MKLTGNFDITVELTYDSDHDTDVMIITTDKGKVTLFYDQWQEIVAFQKAFFSTWND